jgi:hypothetical protein
VRTPCSRLCRASFFCRGFLATIQLARLLHSVWSLDVLRAVDGLDAESPGKVDCPLLRTLAKDTRAFVERGLAALTLADLT